MKENIPLNTYDKKQKNYAIFIGIVFILFIFSFFYLWDIIFPFILGFVIAFVVEPLVRGMSKIKINRFWATILVTLLVLIIILFLLLYVTPTIINVITKLVRTISVNLQNNTVFSQSVINWFLQHNINLNQDRILLSIQENFSRILNTILSSALGLVGSGVKMGETILIALLTFFYTLKEKAHIIDLFLKLVPSNKKNSIILFISHSTFQIRQFIKSLVLVSFIIFIFMIILLHAFSTPFATPLAIFSGVISIIPYIGPMIHVIVIAFVQLTQAQPLTSIVWIILIQGIFYVFIAFYLHPLITGKAVKVHSLVIILCIVIGGHLGGIFGILISIPCFIVGRNIFLFYLQKYDPDETHLTIHKDP